MRDSGKTGADAAPLDNAIHVLGFAFEDSLYASVREISHPAGNMMPEGFLNGPGSECNSLDPACDGYVYALHILRKKVKG